MTDTPEGKAWQRAVDFVLRHEGGYVNDPDDPGGETKYGISKRAHPGLDIKQLNKMDAIRIYGADYWRPPGCHLLPWPLNLLLFDATVQHGAYMAIRLLQGPLGVKVDGLNGLRTQIAAETALKQGRDIVGEVLAARALH